MTIGGGLRLLMCAVGDEAAGRCDPTVPVLVAERPRGSLFTVS